MSTLGDETTFDRLRALGVTVTVVNQIVTELENDFGSPDGPSCSKDHVRRDHLQTYQVAAKAVLQLSNWKDGCRTASPSTFTTLPARLFPMKYRWPIVCGQSRRCIRLGPLVSRTLVALLIGWPLNSIRTAAQAVASSKSHTPAPYTPHVWDIDWRYLANPANRQDLDGMVYIMYVSVLAILNTYRSTVRYGSAVNTRIIRPLVRNLQTTGISSSGTYRVPICILVRDSEPSFSSTVAS